MSNPEDVRIPLSNFKPDDIYELVFRMKIFLENQPEQGKKLLLDHPEFARVMAQALYRLDMLKTPNSTSQNSSLAIAGLDAEQQEVIRKVQSMTAEDLMSLPEDQRECFQQLRDALGLPSLLQPSHHSRR